MPINLKVMRRLDLLADGMEDHEIRALLHDGELRTLRRGSYASGGIPDDTVVQHILQIRAAVPDLSDEAVVSHQSAAVMHGLPLWRTSLDAVHATRNRRRSGARARSTVHLHCAPLGADEIVVVGDVAVTSPARTVVDVARTAGFEQGVVTADAALARELVTPGALAAALERVHRWPGTPQARRVVAFADGRAESVGESRSRVAIARAGLPAPELQWRIVLDDGSVVRGDFGWEDHRTVGEFDGRIKYGRLLAPGQEPGDAVFQEKRREDLIRATGLGVTRWTWDDLDRFGPVAARIRAQFDRAARV